MVLATEHINVDSVTIDTNKDAAVVTAEVKNASEKTKVMSLYAYVGEMWADYAAKILKAYETQQITFSLPPEYFADGQELILTTRNYDNGVVYRERLTDTGPEPESPKEKLAADEEYLETRDTHKASSTQYKTEGFDETHTDESSVETERDVEEGDTEESPPHSIADMPADDRSNGNEEMEQQSSSIADSIADEHATSVETEPVSSEEAEGQSEGEKERPVDSEENELKDYDSNEPWNTQKPYDTSSKPLAHYDKRISTGIIGLDPKMSDGFVEASINLVTGKTGTGKTAFAASFLQEGATQHEPGVYVTTEERDEDLKGDIYSMFGWDFHQHEKNNLVKLISLKPVFPSEEVDDFGRLVRSYITNLLSDVEDAIEEVGANRVVIDSVSIIEMFIKDEYLARVALASLMNNLRSMEVTTLLTGTVPETSEGLSGGGIIEFLVDTVIKLEFMPIAEEYKRTLTIRKMRRTDHSVQIMPIQITDGGLEIIEVD